MKKWVFVLAVIALFLSVIGGALIGYINVQAKPKEVAATKADLPVVNVVSPTPLEQSSMLQFAARLAPFQQASLFARSSGFVTTQRVDIGSVVKAGDVLATISAPELEASLHASKATLLQRKAELLVATQNLERAEPLGQAGAVSASEIDALRAMRDVAQANLAVANADVERLQSEVAYLTVRAPFNGTITQRNIDRGDRVSPNDTRMLYRIINNDVIRVEVDVPQPQFFRVDTAKAGQLVLAERPGELMPVKFGRSAGELSAETGTVRMEYELDNRKLKLPAGLTGGLMVSANGVGTSVTIPANAVVYRDGGATVVVVDADKQLQFRKVSLGKNMASTVEVVQGVGTQDQVVINPNALLRPGQAVEVRTLAG